MNSAIPDIQYMLKYLRNSAGAVKNRKFLTLDRPATENYICASLLNVQSIALFVLIREHVKAQD